jgi:hypothetical protein
MAAVLSAGMAADPAAADLFRFLMSSSEQVFHWRIYQSGRLLPLERLL